MCASKKNEKQESPCLPVMAGFHSNVPRTCQRCGAIAEACHKFCPDCGKPLLGSNAQEEQEDSKPPPENPMQILQTLGADNRSELIPGHIRENSNEKAVITSPHGVVLISSQVVG